MTIGSLAMADDKSVTAASTVPRVCKQMLTLGQCDQSLTTGVLWSGTFDVASAVRERQLFAGKWVVTGSGVGCREFSAGDAQVFDTREPVLNANEHGVTAS
jgi:hypothetical protein